MKVLIANDEKSIIDNLTLRGEIFLNELKYDIEMVFDYNDQISTLFNVINEDNIIGIARLEIKNGFANVSFIGITKDARGLGVGSFLLDSIYQYIEKNTSIRSIRVFSTLDSIPFFEKNGFIKIDIPIKENDIIFQEMRKSIYTFSH